jgi:hypothetical protein
MQEAPETQDTPAQEDTEAPVEDTPTAPTVDYEQRYNSLRPEFDRTRQQLAEQEARIQQYEERIAQLDQQPADDGYYEDGEEFADPVARQQIAHLEAQLRERAEQDTLREQQAAEAAHIDAELDAIESETNDQLTDEESAWIGNYALANRDEHGRPDVRLAYQTYTGLLEGRKSKWVESKRSAPAPASGPGAVEVPDLDDPDALEDHINRRLGLD